MLQAGAQLHQLSVGDHVSVECTEAEPARKVLLLLTKIHRIENSRSETSLLAHILLGKLKGVTGTGTTCWRKLAIFNQSLVVRLAPKFGPLPEATSGKADFYTPGIHSSVYNSKLRISIIVMALSMPVPYPGSVPV
jgi:hypothetical protein